MALDEIYIELHTVTHRDGQGDLETKERKTLEPTTLHAIRQASNPLWEDNVRTARTALGMEIWDLLLRARNYVDSETSGV